MQNYSSNNPMLKKSILSKASTDNYVKLMTHGGTVQKTSILFVILMLGASISWFSNYAILSLPAAWISLLIGGTVLSFITAFVPKASPVTAPIYALIEGMLLGAVSAAFGLAYNGIVFEALLITIGIFVMTLIFYAAGFIKVTNRLRTGIIIATLGVFFVYLVDMILSFAGIQVSFLNGNGIVGLAINLIIVIIASLNFFLDFDYVNRACMTGAPKYMEWYMGYSIMVTFVWLYLEVLRLISKISSRS